MDLDEQRLEARRQFEAGNIPAAVALQQALLDRQDPRDEDAMGDLLLLAQYLSGIGGYEPILRLLEQRREQGVKRFDYCLNLGVCYQNLGRYDEALTMLLSARKLEPESADVHARLAAVFRQLGKEQESLRCGELALLLKGKQTLAGQVYPLPAERPKFRADRPAKNVIAFTIPAATPEYLNGALANAIYAPMIYPGWSCRFYYSGELPADFLRELVSCGVMIAQVAGRGRLSEPQLWPLHVCSDQSVDYFLIRDVRALVNVRERAAVDQWLASDRFFHVMRDHWLQTDLLPMGLWGGVAGVLPSSTKLLKGYKAEHLRTNWVSDMLAARLWPTIKQSCLVHDSNYQAFGAKAFPSIGELAPGQYVGQDARGWRQAAPFASLRAMMRDLTINAGGTHWEESLRTKPSEDEEKRNNPLFDAGDILI